MNPDDLARILDELGQRLGPTGERVFALAVRQVYVDAFTAGSIAFAALVTLLAGAVWRSRRGPHDKIVDVGASLVAAALAFIFLVLAISPVLNPEYAAIRDLLGALKP